MKASPYVIDYYSNYGGDSRLNPRYETVEFLTTIRYIEKYIKSGSRILEIGTRTGRYSRVLTHLGYMVDTIEPVPHNMEAFCSHVLSVEHITVTQDNVLDSSTFSDNQYDTALLLGPLYHLYTEKDKHQALGETTRVTKQSGIIFAAYVISDGCPLDEGLNRGGINVVEYTKNGLLGPEAFAIKSGLRNLFELVRKEDIGDLMSVFSATCLYCAASDDCALLVRGAIGKMGDETFQLYLKYHYATCKRKDLTGIISHAINIFRRQTTYLKTSPKTGQS